MKLTCIKALLFIIVIASSFKNKNFKRKDFAYESLHSYEIGFSTPTNIPDQDGRVPSYFLSKKSFEDIGVTSTLTSVLNYLNLEGPSKIQAIAFKPIFNGTSCIVADQTGSGKTLSYLLPIVQRVTELKAQRLIPQPGPREPYVLIITPTTELANQVARVVKSIANVLKFRTACFTSECDIDSEQKKLRLGSDILVSTPGRVVSLLKKGDLSLAHAQTVVLDEADVLFSDLSFPLQPLGQACPLSTQFVFVTATIPEVVTNQIKAEFPDVAYITGPGLHRIAPTIEEVLVDCSGPHDQERNFETSFDNKKSALLRVLSDYPSERTLIFCNTIAQCRNVENALLRADRQGKARNVVVYHGAVQSVQRDEAMVAFSKRLLPKPVVMICTDRASRGIDFDQAPVGHVILFDFPQEPSEYVRRVGRTGRAGRFGRATVLVQGRQVGIAKSIMSASLAGKRIEPIPELNAFESWTKK